MYKSKGKEATSLRDGTTSWRLAVTRRHDKTYKNYNSQINVGFIHENVKPTIFKQVFLKMRVFLKLHPILLRWPYCNFVFILHISFALTYMLIIRACVSRIQGGCGLICTHNKSAYIVRLTMVKWNIFCRVIVLCLFHVLILRGFII